VAAVGCSIGGVVAEAVGSYASPYLTITLTVATAARFKVWWGIYDFVGGDDHEPHQPKQQHCFLRITRLRL